MITHDVNKYLDFLGVGGTFVIDDLMHKMRIGGHHRASVITAINGHVRRGRITLLPERIVRAAQYEIVS